MGLLAIEMSRKLLAERGLDISYETVRWRGAEFAPVIPRHTVHLAVWVILYLPFIVAPLFASMAGWLPPDA